MATSTDYTGRLVDISIFPALKEPSTLVNAEFGITTKAIAGAMSIAQNFARLILTPLGHYKSDPTLGSNFYQKLSLRQLQFPGDLDHIFMIESDKVIRYLNLLADAATVPLPDDEKIKTATLVSSSVSGTTIDLTIQIETVAGDTVSFLLPVQWSI